MSLPWRPPSRAPTARELPTRSVLPSALAVGMLTLLLAASATLELTPENFVRAHTIRLFFFY